MKLPAPPRAVLLVSYKIALFIYHPHVLPGIVSGRGCLRLHFKGTVKKNIGIWPTTPGFQWFLFQSFCFVSMNKFKDWQSLSSSKCICSGVVDTSAARKKWPLGRQRLQLRYDVWQLHLRIRGRVVGEQQQLWKETTWNWIYIYIYIYLYNMTMISNLQWQRIAHIKKSQKSLNFGACGIRVTKSASLRGLLWHREHLFSLRLLNVNNHRTRKSFQQCHHFTHNSQTSKQKDTSKKVMQSKKKQSAQGIYVSLLWFTKSTNQIKSVHS